jgi:hypothetical protein
MFLKRVDMPDFEYSEITVLIVFPAIHEHQESIGMVYLIISTAETEENNKGERFKQQCQKFITGKHKFFCGLGGYLHR